ncbi:MAG TPA: ParB/RepB/Spo0J family partition protein [Anaerolineales bacterium]|nr:ParB/RepB/Spo0J family partition protein [Anaerolineales bacterium]
MPKRTGLGKGLDALIPTGERIVTPAGGGVLQVSVDSIQRNPHQPRTHFDEQDLADLSASIREHGVLQPLIVSPGNDGTYMLIAGERRWQAAQRAGLKTVPVITRQASNQELLELALIENIQRADLNALEEAEAYHQLTEEFGLSHDAVAARVSKSRVAVTNTLRLLSASVAVKQALADDQITEGHARALLGLSSAKAQDAALQTVLKLSLSVRQTEGLVKKLGGVKAAAKKKPSRSPDVSDVEKRLRNSLGTKVSLRHGKKGGTVTIHYYSDEELDALLDKLL